MQIIPHSLRCGGQIVPFNHCSLLNLCITSESFLTSSGGSNDELELAKEFQSMCHSRERKNKKTKKQKHLLRGIFLYGCSWWPSRALWKRFQQPACSLPPAGLLSSPAWYLHPLLWESTWMTGTEPVFTLWGSWHTQCLSTLPITCLLMQTFFFFCLMYSSPDCRHLVNPFRTYQLCSSAHKPITLEAQCWGTQVPDQCTKPNWVM